MLGWLCDLAVLFVRRLLWCPRQEQVDGPPPFGRASSQQMLGQLSDTLIGFDPAMHKHPHQMTGPWVGFLSATCVAVSPQAGHLGALR